MTTLSKLIEALNGLSDGVLKGWTDDRTLTEAFGWNLPALTRQELAFRPKRIAEKLTWLGEVELTQHQEKRFVDAVKRIELCKKQTLQYLFTGNHNIQAIPAYMLLLDWIDEAVAPLFSWEKVENNKELPPALKKRLRSLELEITKLESDYPELESKAKIVADAYEAAENLPILLKDLEEATEEISARREASKNNALVLENLEKSAIVTAASLEKYEKRSIEIIKTCESALQISTSYGLASAFEEQKKSLQWSIRWWVGILLIVLGVGGWIGHIRIETLTNLLSNEKIDPLFLVFNFVLSVLSVGAPLWVAWLATSQITQKFRLTEDYAFKASISKAYEGYRQQAEKLDTQFADNNFAVKLFESALTRLNEPPLDQIEKKVHATPWSQVLYEVFSKKGTNAGLQPTKVNLPENDKQA